MVKCHSVSTYTAYGQSREVDKNLEHANGLLGYGLKSGRADSDVTERSTSAVFTYYQKIVKAESRDSFQRQMVGGHGSANTTKKLLNPTRCSQRLNIRVI